MGAVTFSLDPSLITALKKALQFDVFIETGTFKGDTIELVKDHFSEIYSIELSEDYYSAAVDRFRNVPHLTLIHENSPSAIKNILSDVENRPVLFWLDAHWCVAKNTAGELSQCPLLDEIDAISTLNKNSMIIIDDARLFLSPPSAPHEISDWPKFSAVLAALHKLSDSHNVMIINDCILFFPLSVEKVLDEFAYHHGVNWLTVMDKSKDYDVLLQQLLEKEKEMTYLATEAGKRADIIQSLVKEIEKNKELIQSVYVEREKKSHFPRNGIKKITSKIESRFRKFLNSDVK